MASVSWLRISLMLVTIGCVVSMRKPCSRQSDCDPYWECCSKRAFSDESFCVLRRRLNEICLANGMDEMMYNGIYDINCPCQYGLECRTDMEQAPNGAEIGLPRNPRCYGPPQRNFFSNGIQGSNNNAQASAFSGSTSESSAQGSGSSSESSAQSGQSNSAAQANSGK